MRVYNLLSSNGLRRTTKCSICAGLLARTGEEGRVSKGGGFDSNDESSDVVVVGEGAVDGLVTSVRYCHWKEVTYLL